MFWCDDVNILDYIVIVLLSTFVDITVTMSLSLSNPT